MLVPSHETITIREIISRMTDDELKSTGPKGLQRAVEDAGLNYGSVREKINNELARARRNKGIRKGQGRRKAIQWPTDEEFVSQVQLFIEVEKFKESRFKTWSELREVAEQLFAFAQRCGSPQSLMQVIEIKLQDEATETKGG